MNSASGASPAEGQGAGPAGAEAEQLFRRAETALAAGRHGEAGPLYRRLLEAGYLPGVQLFRLGMLANARRDFEGAWELHRRALAIDPALASRVTRASCRHQGVVCRGPYDTEDVPLCPVCGGDQQGPRMVVNLLPFEHYHASFDPVRRWVACRACGHAFANPRPAAAALAAAFRDPPPAHLTQWSYERLAAWSDVVHALWQVRPGGDLLDVGAGNGGLAAVAAEYGYRACAVDLHPGYGGWVRRLGVEFVLGDLCDLDLGGRLFDVVTLGDVLEHVAGPRAALARALALLRPGGLLWLSTPNHEGAWARGLGYRDPMWLEGEHLHYFCRRSLERLLGDQGLRVTDLRLSRRFAGSIEALVERTRA
jgi:SAM-dependent methyltransferase